MKRSTNISAQQRNIFNIALNDDFKSFSKVIMAYSGSLNFLSASGEAPIHISIYKRNLDLVSLLISRGADPNFSNIRGETAVHLACRIGWFEGLVVLYNSEKCLFNIKNRSGESALAISSIYPQLSDISLLHVYTSWSVDKDLDEEVRDMVSGRKQCYEFLIQKIEVDRQRHENRLIESSINYQRQELNKRLILRGGISRIGSMQHQQPRFPFGHMPSSWEGSDLECLSQCPSGQVKIMASSFSQRYVLELLLTAVSNVAQISHNS